MYQVTVRMRSEFISNSLAEMLRREEYSSAHRDERGVRIQCADFAAVSGLVSALSYTEMQIDGIEISASGSVSGARSAGANH